MDLVSQNQNLFSRRRKQFAGPAVDHVSHNDFILRHHSSKFYSGLHTELNNLYEQTRKGFNKIINIWRGGKCRTRSFFSSSRYLVIFYGVLTP